jgi:hypothetical protein
VLLKLNKVNETLPEYEETIDTKNQKLKESKRLLNIVNLENLKLMEKIQMLEMEKERAEVNNSSMQMGRTNIESSYDGANTLRYSKAEDMDITSKDLTVLTNRFKYSVYGKGDTVNLTQIVDENENLKELLDDINLHKKRLQGMRKNNTNISKEIANINNKVFLLSKLFNEGFHEISRELLKIHEVQLDKLLKGKST